jgi:hypothetical protein
MKTYIFIILGLLLSPSSVYTSTNTPAIRPEFADDPYLRERQEYYEATAAVEELVQAGKLQEAEEAVERLEPQYAGKWAVGAFGFRTRMQIAQVYLDRGDRKEAMRLFKAAKPGGGCGNCMASQHVRRNIQVARIYESRLNFPAAFAAYLGALSGTSLGGGSPRVLLGLAYSGGATLLPLLPAAYLIHRLRKRKRAQPEARQSTPENT